MANIKGNKDLIQRVKDSKPGDKWNYVNLEAIRELPEEYEAIITEVTFNKNKINESFSDVGNGNYMPTPQMHYRIADAKGISGGDNAVSKPIYEEVNFSEMLMEDMPKMVTMLVGYSCTKYSTVLEQDGSMRRSSPCTIDYNAWNRCVELWSKEEERTDGYDPLVVKEGKYGKYYVYEYKGDKKNIGLKYDTKFKRKKHFYEELKFAQQKAETKAHEKTIRELAGLMTGYRQEDLKEGRLVFAKIQRSSDVLRMETAARLDYLRNGGQMVSPAAMQLFGTQEETEPVDVTPDREQEQATHIEEPEQHENQETRSKREVLKDALSYYKEKDLIDTDALKAATDTMIKWLDSADEKDEKYENFFKKAVSNLESIESSIEKELRYSHSLY